MKKIAVAGAGYVGLANAVLLAQNEEVWIYDVAEEKVQMLKERRSPVKDKEMQEFLDGKELHLHITTDAREAFEDAEFIIIAVPTDYDDETKYFNTTIVEAVTEQAISYAGNSTIVIKSTIPVGYVKKLCERYHPDHIFFSPEFLREGHALYDNLYPSRIVVGIPKETVSCRRRAEEFAGLLKKGAEKIEIPVLVAGSSEAESIKLFANTYLALRVAFFNELDTYAEYRDLNTSQIIEGVCMDPRIGNYYNNPSFGYGGYCLPKDTKQLLANYGEIPENLIEAVVESNRTRKEHITERIMSRNPECTGVYRLVMKSESDNFRQSSIIGIIQRLRNRGKKVVIYEPNLKDDYFEGVEIIKSLQEFKQISDVIIANRESPELNDVSDKVYTRDLYTRD